MKLSLSLFFGILFCQVLSQATTPEYIELREFPRTELSILVGSALQTGYLTSQDAVGSSVVSLSFGLPGGIFAFDWQSFRADHDTGEFALSNNKSVSVTSFSFIPYMRFYSKEAFSALAGLGFVQVGLYQDTPDYQTTYGSFVASALLRYQLNPKWSLQYKTSWYGINQTLNDQSTSFEVWNHSLGAGYTL